MRPEFQLYEYDKIKKNEVRFWIQGDESTSKELIEISKAVLETHLFFYLNGDFSKVYTSREQLAQNSSDLSLLVVIPAHLLIKGEKIVDHLVLSCIEQSEAKIISLENASSQDSPYLVNFNNVEFKDWEHAPNDLSKSFKIPSIDYWHSSFNADQELLESFVAREQEEIDKHLQKGFDKIFLFNTENYTDIESMSVSEQPSQVIGFSSGFKLNRMAEQFRNDDLSIICLDYNEKAVMLKKTMHETWDGTDFPSWLSKYFSEQSEFYEKSEPLLGELWNRELSEWSKLGSIKTHWEWFKNHNVRFVEVNLIEDLQKIIPKISQSGVVVFWISNMWHNEFVYRYFGNSQLWEKYCHWMQLLNQHNPNIFFLQSEVITPAGLKDFNKMYAYEICEEIKKINT